MKTNHRRDFIDSGSFRDRSSETVTRPRIAGGKSHKNIGNDFTNGHRGHARAVRGAKDFVRSRDRIANKGIAREELDLCQDILTIA